MKIIGGLSPQAPYNYGPVSSVSMASSECYFKCGKDAPLITVGKARIESVISSSIARNDKHHVELKQQLQNDPDLKIIFHKTCISTYTSSTHIKQYLKRMRSSIPASEPPRPKLRSTYLAFNFCSHCLICSRDCLPRIQSIQDDGEELLFV